MRVYVSLWSEEVTPKHFMPSQFQESSQNQQHCWHRDLGSTHWVGICLLNQKSKRPHCLPDFKMEREHQGTSLPSLVPFHPRTSKLLNKIWGPLPSGLCPFSPESSIRVVTPVFWMQSWRLFALSWTGHMTIRPLTWNILHRTAPLDWVFCYSLNKYLGFSIYDRFFSSDSPQGVYFLNPPTPHLSIKPSHQGHFLYVQMWCLILIVTWVGWCEEPT